MKREIDEVLALLADHGSQLHALLARLTLRDDVAEDLMQELFLRLSRPGGFSRAKDPIAYAFRSATNLAFDWRRGQNRSPRTEPICDQLHDHDRQPLTKLVDREQLQCVLNALGELPKRSRDIVVMRYLQQQSYEGIGRLLGKTSHQARGLCHKALDRLRRLIYKQTSVPQESGGSQDE